MRLSDVIETAGQEILAEWLVSAKAIAAAHQMSTPALVDSVPDLLEKLVSWLREGDGSDRGSVDAIARHHAADRFKNGYSLPQLVAEYGALRSAVLARVATSLGTENVPELRLLNDTFDLAIAIAVEHYVDQGHRATLASSARLQAVIDNAPAVIFVKEYRGANGIFVMVNRMFLHRFANDRRCEEVLRKTERELHPDVDEHYIRRFDVHDRVVLERGKAVRADERAVRQVRFRRWQAWIIATDSTTSSLRSSRTRNCWTVATRPGATRTRSRIW